MANVFSRVLATGTSAGSVLATVTTTSKWVIIGLTAANTTGSLVTISVDINGTYIVKDVPIPSGSMLPILDGKIVMNGDDVLSEICSVDASVDFVVSYMEMT